MGERLIPGTATLYTAMSMPMEDQKPARRARFGLYEADFAAGELRKSGTRLRLQEQPFQVLAMLLDRAGEPVTREDLRSRLWPADTFVDFDHSLNTAINKLRDVLGDTASNPRFIETLPRRGYRFIAPVEWTKDGENGNAPALSEQPAADAAVASAAVPVHPDLPRATRGMTRLLFGLLQLMYLIFYACGLWRLEEIADIAETSFHAHAIHVEVLTLVSGVIGVVLRLYTFSATAFDHPGTGVKFRRLLPLVFLLDLIWAFSPFFLIQHIGVGLAFASCAALLYSPFAQRVLARVTWPAENGDK